MVVYTCPKGHSSDEADFCSECGARIQGSASQGAGVEAQAAPAAARQSPSVCPDCGAPHSADQANFCEVCGYNFVTGAHGEIPIPAPPPMPALTNNGAASAQAEPSESKDSVAETPSHTWKLIVAVDPTLQQAGSPVPPSGVGPFTVTVTKAVNLIGRSSPKRAIFPEIPLDYDDAVSHRHAVLSIGVEGALVLRDIGSANGTRLNGSDVQPLTDTPVGDGDQLTLGHWTRITVKAGE